MQNISHSANVVRRFNLAFHQSANIFSAELCHKVSVLKYNVLTSPILWSGISLVVPTALIAWRIEDKRKIGVVCVSLNFLDNGHASVGLLVQNDCFESKTFDKSTDFNSCEIVSSVNDENLPLVSCNNWRRSNERRWG